MERNDQVWSKLDAYCEKLIRLMAKFEPMQDGTLGHISEAKIYVELPSDKFRAVHDARYRAGLRTLEFKKLKIGKW